MTKSSKKVRPFSRKQHWQSHKYSRARRSGNGVRYGKRGKR